jgi:hypothetical protein
MDGFISFMRSPTGRLLRIVLGAYLMYIGFAGTAGMLVGVIGIIPVLAGVMNFCVLAPLFGYTLMGKKRTPAS